MPLDEALQTIETVTGVEALFKPPEPRLFRIEGFIAEGFLRDVSWTYKVLSLGFRTLDE